MEDGAIIFDSNWELEAFRTIAEFDMPDSRIDRTRLPSEVISHLDRSIFPNIIV
jgi:hypothetical protein